MVCGLCGNQLMALVDKSGFFGSWRLYQEEGNRHTAQSHCKL